MVCSKCEGRGWILVTRRGNVAAQALSGMALEREACTDCPEAEINVRPTVSAPRRRRTREELIELSRRAIELYTSDSSMTYDKVAERLGVSHATAYRVINTPYN